MDTTTEARKMGTGTTEGPQEDLVAETVRMLISPEGGLNALAQAFQRNGLGHIISSWIGSGDNLPISTDEIESVLGSQRVAELAKKVGMSPDAANSFLTKALPRLVDALTPNGKVDSRDDLMARSKHILTAFTEKNQRT